MKRIILLKLELLTYQEKEKIKKLMVKIESEDKK